MSTQFTNKKSLRLDFWENSRTIGVYILFFTIMTAKKQKQKNALSSQEEKDALLASLKQTMHDLGRLPWLIFAPVIGYVSAHYAKIPEERKSHLQNILDEIKAWGSEGVWKLKDRFKGIITPQPATGKDQKSSWWTTKKTAPEKPSSRTDKLKNATSAVAEKAKETSKKAAAAATSTHDKKSTPKKVATKKPVAKKPATSVAKKPAPKKTTVQTSKKTTPKKAATKKPVAQKRVTKKTPTTTPKKTTTVKKPVAKKTISQK